MKSMESMDSWNSVKDAESGKSMKGVDSVKGAESRRGVDSVKRRMGITAILPARITAILLVAALITGVFAAMPLAAGAASDSGRIDLGEAWFGNTDKDLFAWKYSVSEHKITVTREVEVIGNITGASKTLTIENTDGTTVKWKANYSGTINKDNSGGGLSYYETSGLVGITGMGSFEVVDGASIINRGDGFAIYGEGAYNTNLIKVSGGTVDSEGDYSICTLGIMKVIVSGGRVGGISASGSTIEMSGGAAKSLAGQNITVSGGMVTYTGAGAILYHGDPVFGPASVNVSGGFVFSVDDFYYQGNELDDPAYDAIVMGSSGATPSIGGTGVVCSWKCPEIAKYPQWKAAYTAGTSDDLRVKPAGATVKWAKEGEKMGVAWKNGANTGFYPLSKVVVTEPGKCVVTFVMGDSSPPYQIVSSGGRATRPADPVWDDHVFTGWYNEPEHINAYDFNSAITRHTIIYGDWKRTKDYPTITGPEAMALATGYAATSTGAYTLANAPSPQVALSNTHGGKISWNDAGKKLDIAAGLLAGEYVVVITMSNFDLDDATLTFKLTVADPGSGNNAPSPTPTATPPSVAPPTPQAPLATANPAVPGKKDYGALALKKAAHDAFMLGYTDGSFGINANMTRAEAVVPFFRLLQNSPDVQEVINGDFAIPYSDVGPSDWYAPYIGYLYSLGVLDDYSQGGAFRPGEPVTRAEFAIMASNFEALEPAGALIFSDVPESHRAAKYINSVAAKGWIRGYPDGTFKPDSLLNRMEAVTIICRMLGRSADDAYLAAHADSLPRTFSDVPRDLWAYVWIMEAAIGHDYERLDDGAERWTAVR